MEVTSFVSARLEMEAVNDAGMDVFEVWRQARQQTAVVRAHLQD
jgi:hypothetical protein